MFLPDVTDIVVKDNARFSSPCFTIDVTVTSFIKAFYEMDRL